MTEETISKLIGLGVPFALNLAVASVIYMIGKWLAGIVSRVIEKLMLKGKVDAALAGF